MAQGLGCHMEELLPRSVAVPCGSLEHRRDGILVALRSGHMGYLRSAPRRMMAWSCEWEWLAFPAHDPH